MKPLGIVVAIVILVATCGSGGGSVTCEPDIADSGTYRDVDFEIAGSIWKKWFEADEDGNHNGRIWLQYDELDEDGVVLSNETRTYEGGISAALQQEFGDEFGDVGWDEVTDELEVRECRVTIIRRNNRNGGVLWETEL